MPDQVFISYAHDDGEFVHALARRLKWRSVPVWVDQWDIPGGADWDRAIEAAQNAFPDWSARSFQERAKLLLKIADVWEKRKDEFINAVMYEGGGWYGKGVFEAGFVAEIFRTSASLCYQSIGEVLPSEHGKVSMATRWPLGVVGVISPWNMPGILTSRGFAFPMAMGNTIVLKPSEDTPYAGGLFFAEVLEEVGVPAGVFNVVTCARERVAEMAEEVARAFEPLVAGHPRSAPVLRVRVELRIVLVDDPPDQANPLDVAGGRELIRDSQDEPRGKELDQPVDARRKHAFGEGVVEVDGVARIVILPDD